MNLQEKLNLIPDGYVIMKTKHSVHLFLSRQDFINDEVFCSSPNPEELANQAIRQLIPVSGPISSFWIDAFLK